MCAVLTLMSYSFQTFSLPIKLPYCVLQTGYIMLVKLYYWNYAGDRVPEILPSRAPFWPALIYFFSSSHFNFSTFLLSPPFFLFFSLFPDCLSYFMFPRFVAPFRTHSVITRTFSPVRVQLKCDGTRWRTGHVGKWTRNTWKVLKCGAGEGWRRSLGVMVWEVTRYYTVSRTTGISYIQQDNARIT